MSDVAGFAFSIIAIYIVRNPQYFGKTYGNARADTIGALVTILIIWTLLGVLIYESIERIIHIDTVKIDGKIMLITSCIGLFFNLINMFVLEYAFNADTPKEKGADIELGEKDGKVAPSQSPDK